MWWRIRPVRKPCHDEPSPADLPSSVSTAALFANDCLVTQLICGDITGAQYRAAIAKLAADEDGQHPLVVPPAACWRTRQEDPAGGVSDARRATRPADAGTPPR